MQPFADIPTLSDLASGPVLLLLGGANLAEVDLDVQRELEGGSMEGASLLFRQPGLILRQRSVQGNPTLETYLRRGAAASVQDTRARRRAVRMFDAPDGGRLLSTLRRTGRSRG